VRVLSNVRVLSDDQEGAVDEAIDRLVKKRILQRDGESLRLR
jgi:hypothetical protein